MSHLRRSILSPVSLGLLAVALVALTAATDARRAPAPRLEVYLSNSTNYDIPYSLRFGNGKWQRHTLAPGQKWTWWAPAGSSGSFEVIFSRDLGYDVGGVAEARLDPFGDYYFGVRPSGLTLDLYRR